MCWFSVDTSFIRVINFLIKISKKGNVLSFSNSKANFIDDLKNDLNHLNCIPF